MKSLKTVLSIIVSWTPCNIAVSKTSLMKKFTFITALLLLTTYGFSNAQGVSISVLIPKSGYLSTPVSPLSIRGLGYNWGAIGFSTGGSLYNMPGLPLENVPFNSDKPLTGPYWSVLVPLQLTLEFHSKAVSVRFLGGGFGMVHLFPQLNYGNVDRAIADYQGVPNSNLTVVMLEGIVVLKKKKLTILMHKYY